MPHRAFAVVVTCSLLFLTSSPGRAAGVELSVLPPECLAPWQRVLMLAGLGAELLEERGGDFSTLQSGPGALRRNGAIAVPGAAHTTAVLDEWPAGSPTTEISVLETPFEWILLERPIASYDLLTGLERLAADSGGRFPDVVRRQLEASMDDEALTLHTGAARDQPSPNELRREVFARFSFQIGSETGSLVAIARSLAGPGRF
ncbi:MAG: hypothetical protein ACO3JL_13765, partial [Myxococcota bacterium]